MSKAVPVNIRMLKCFFLDRSQLPEEGDCTSDEMEKGKYVNNMWYRSSSIYKPYILWHKRKNTWQIPQNCKVVTALKNTWVHSKVKGCQKTMICIKENLLVFIQYIGLNNQPELKLGNRQIGPVHLKWSPTKWRMSKAQNVLCIMWQRK